MSKLLKIGYLLFLLLLLFMAVEAYKYRGNVSFDPEEIVKKSILKDKTFETNVVEIVSENGIKAYLFEDHTIPIISIDFLFKNSGISYDEAGYEGIGNMVSALLTEGAGDLDNDKLKEELELYAIGISFGVDFDDFKGSLLTLSENKEKAYNLLNLALTKPRFDDENAALAKQRMNFALRMQSERPDSVLGLEFAKNIYGRHPYSRNPVGQKQAIAKITRKDMQNYIKENLTTDKLVVGISGDITPDEAGKVLDKIFQGLKKEGLNKEISAADIVFDGRDVEIKRKSAQNIAIFANRALERTDTDFYPLYVVNYIFGEAGLGSRLSLKAREEEGLTYGIYTSIVNRQKSDMLRGRFSATPENYYRVIEIVKNEWKNMGSKGITEAELKSAKDYLIASYNLRFASIDNISSMLTYMQRYNLGIDFLQKRNEYVRNITLEQANGAAEKYFNDDNLIFISIGNFNREISGENDNGK